MLTLLSMGLSDADCFAKYIKKIMLSSMHRNREQLYLGTDSHKVRTGRQARNHFSVMQQVSFQWKLDELH